MLSLCFASIQAMDPDPNHEIDRLTLDIFNNDIASVQTMLERNPELVYAHGRSSICKGGNPPMLMFALIGEKDHLEMVKLLLKYGPEVDACGQDGYTPLMIAAHLGQRGNVRLLLEAGADASLKNRCGSTALIATIQNNKEEFDIIKQLLDHGTNIDEQNDNGETVLMHAALRSHLEKQETITLLLESGADPTIRDNENRTPADIARLKGNEALAKLIENYQFGKNIKGE